MSFVERSPSPLSLYYVANTSFDEHYSQQISTNAPLTMVGVPRIVPTLKALLCAAVEVDSSLQAMDWTVMVWYCYQRMERGGEPVRRQNQSI